MTIQHNASFEARLQRIRAAQRSGEATVYVGQDLVFNYVPKNRRNRLAAADVAHTAGLALLFPFSMAIGFLGHALERYTDWLLRGVSQTPGNGDIEMALSALTSACLAVVLGHLAGLRDRALLFPTLLGVAAGVLGFHNLVHLYPEVFETIFSPVWVAKVTSTTLPQSLLFRGISFPF